MWDGFVSLNVLTNGNQWVAPAVSSGEITALQQNFCALSSKMLHKIVKLTVMDVRFPTSLEQHGSDAMVRKQK